MSALPSPTTSHSFGRAVEIAADVLTATAVMWVPPLLLAAVAAVIRALL
jgi:hypothetical protein